MLRRWLSSHHGVIGYAEARRIGATAGIIQTKVERGEWARMHRGVYRDTAAPPGPKQDLRGAFVAAGGLGVVSHVSAAWLWGLLPQPPAIPDLTVRIGSRDPRGHDGLKIHRSSDLDLSAAVNHSNMLVTNPMRTLVDIAGAVLPPDLTDAVDAALGRRLVTTRALVAEIDRLSRPGRTGVGALRRHLHERGFTGAPEPSVLEAHAQRLILGTGLPLPTVELRVGDDLNYRLDLAWADIAFAVEVDGYRWHCTPEQKERDETRRNNLRRMGWTVFVYTWRQVTREPDRVAREITDMYRRLSRL